MTAQGEKCHWQLLLESFTRKNTFFPKSSTLFQVLMNSLFWWEHLRISCDRVMCLPFLLVCYCFCFVFWKTFDFAQQNVLQKYCKPGEDNLFKFSTDAVSLPRRIHIFFICLGCVTPFTDMYEFWSLSE